MKRCKNTKGSGGTLEATEDVIASAVVGRIQSSIGFVITKS